MYTTLLALVILTLAATAALGIAYRQYLHTPAWMWKCGVLARMQALKKRRECLRSRIADVNAVVEQLADKYFIKYSIRYLRTIPIADLAKYSGIGPVTITKLQNRGLCTLADVFAFGLERITNIGPKRSRAFRVALDEHIQRAQACFNAGGCTEAQEYRRQVDALRATEGEQHTKQELKDVEAALHEVSKLLPLAREVTFLHFLFRSDVETSLAAIMARPLPGDPKPTMSSNQRVRRGSPPLDHTPRL